MSDVFFNLTLIFAVVIPGALAWLAADRYLKRYPFGREDRW